MQEQSSKSLDAAVLSFNRFEAWPRDRVKIGYPHVKRGFDVCFVCIAIAFALPLILMTALAVLVLQGRPILIRHERVGQDGKRFPCLKFRSMVRDADAVLRRHLEQDPVARTEWAATRKLKNDPRITPLGSALRKSSLDELPQLFNVLRGDMSLVGPRPVVDAELAHYGADVRHYLRVRPGLTGLWQVSGRSDVSYPTRVGMDVKYVTDMRFASDLMILLKTIPAVVRSHGSY